MKIKILCFYILFLCACNHSHKEAESYSTRASVDNTKDNISIGNADTIHSLSNIEVYFWPWNEGPTYSQLKKQYGRPSTYERIEYEHCFEKNDTVKPFYKFYLIKPHEFYALCIWKNIEDSNEDLILYLSGEVSADRAFWGYRCRPEDFTTDIYKIE